MTLLTEADTGLARRVNVVRPAPTMKRPRFAFTAVFPLPNRSLRATDVRGTDRHARDQNGIASERFGGRKRVHDIARHHFLLEDVLDVHDGRLSRYRDRLLERPHAQIAVDRRREPG